jgi:hypothetical protein
VPHDRSLGLLPLPPRDTDIHLGMAGHALSRETCRKPPDRGEVSQYDINLHANPERGRDVGAGVEGVAQILAPVLAQADAWSKGSYRTLRSFAEIFVPTYVKPFDVFANGGKTRDGSSGWTRTSNPPVNSVIYQAGLGQPGTIR